MIPGIETIAFGFFSKAQSIYPCSHQYGDSMRRAPNIHPVVPGAEMVYSEHAGNINVDFDWHSTSTDIQALDGPAPAGYELPAGDGWDESHRRLSHRFVAGNDFNRDGGAYRI
jgi:hypothetical protein